MKFTGLGDIPKLGNFVNDDNIEEALVILKQLKDDLVSRHEKKPILVFGMVNMDASCPVADCVYLNHDSLDDAEKQFFHVVSEEFQTSFYVSKRKLSKILQYSEPFLSFAFLQTTDTCGFHPTELTTSAIKKLKITPRILSVLDYKGFEIEGFGDCVVKVLQQFCDYWNSWADDEFEDYMKPKRQKRDQQS